MTVHTLPERDRGEDLVTALEDFAPLLRTALSALYPVAEILRRRNGAGHPSVTEFLIGTYRLIDAFDADLAEIEDRVGGEVIDMRHKRA